MDVEAPSAMPYVSDAVLSTTVCRGNPVGGGDAVGEGLKVAEAVCVGERVAVIVAEDVTV
jgi:hypothetical protein